MGYNSHSTFTFSLFPFFPQITPRLNFLFSLIMKIYKVTNIKEVNMNNFLTL